MIRVHKAGIKLEDHMGILELYLNDFKQPGLVKDSRNLLSNIMFKYIIASCFKKMYHRAFHLASCFMIKNLTGLNWESVANFKSITIKNDRRLSDFLRMNTEWPISNNNETFGEYVMTFNHSKSLDNPASLDNFLTQASGPLGSTTYVFDLNIAATFHTLLLSSLYYYLCSMMQLKHYSSKKSWDEQKIQRYVGLFCKAVKFFLVSHSNAMRAYFTFVRLPVNYPNSEFSTYYKSEIMAAIHTELHDLGWIKREMEVEDSNDNHRDKEESYIEGSKGLHMTLVYRRALMSFVDHYAGLRILEWRSIALPADESIKLSLIGIKHPMLYYHSWEEMEKVIEACLDFHPIPLDAHE